MTTGQSRLEGIEPECCDAMSFDLDAGHSRGRAIAIRRFWRCVPAVALMMLLALPGTTRGQTNPVVTYHNGNDRAGNYTVPNLILLTAAHLHRDRTFDGGFGGHVYAQPLYWRPAGAAEGQVIVATESNNIIALDASTGVVVWNRLLGAAVNANSIPCGNIDPVGVTGTPVIDRASGSLFVVAQVDRQGSPAVLAFGLSLQDGSDLPGWPVDIPAGLAAKSMSFSPSVQGQRSALTLLDGKLYVPFGGRWGDCGGYHGWIVGCNSILRPSSMAGRRAHGRAVSGLSAAPRQSLIASMSLPETPPAQQAGATARRSSACRRICSTQRRRTAIFLQRIGKTSMLGILTSAAPIPCRSRSTANRWFSPWVRMATPICWIGPTSAESGER